MHPAKYALFCLNIVLTIVTFSETTLIAPPMPSVSVPVLDGIPTLLAKTDPSY